MNSLTFPMPPSGAMNAMNNNSVDSRQHSYAEPTTSRKESLT